MLQVKIFWRVQMWYKILLYIYDNSFTNDPWGGIGIFEDSIIPFFPQALSYVGKRELQEDENMFFFEGATPT